MDESSVHQNGSNGDASIKNARIGISQKKKKKTSKKANKKNQKAKRSWTAKPYPTATFESVLPIARTIFEHAGASREMKRITIFELLGRAADSGPGRTLVTNSSKYGLTVGGYHAEVLRLTDNAITILNSASTQASRTRATFNLAIQSIGPFNSLYEKFKGGRLPAVQVMMDSLEEIASENRQECVELFVGNLDFIGLLNLVDGAQWIIDVDRSIDKVRTTDHSQPQITAGSEKEAEPRQSDFDSICFFMAPIGEEGDIERKHSDMVLSTLVTPALSQSGLNVVRADQIVKPGMISKQIIEYILKSKLVIVDLSFHNPNVFYELAIRHLLGKPTVHIVKKSDGIPFDIGNFRTIELEDMGYEFVARIETHKVTIANYVREALDGSSSADNPILTFFPELRVTLSTTNN
ncbi:MAG TPA: hypothetical protein VF088_05080 [Pyrinomonadaceae bacterium]